jgi:hypothetical protein
MQMSCSCQKSRKQEDTEREREGRKESGRHGSNDGCLRTAYTRIEEREGEENECERETEKRRMTSPAAETDYKKRKEGGRAKQCAAKRISPLL